MSDISISNNGSKVSSSQRQSASLNLTDWLKTLKFGKEALAPLRQAAADGNVEGFAEELSQTWKKAERGSQKARQKHRQQMIDLICDDWKNESLSSSEGFHSDGLFQGDLTSDELCGRIETILACNSEETPDLQQLLFGLLLLKNKSHELSPLTLVPFWRWVVDSGLSVVTQAEASEEFHFDELDHIEAVLLLGMLTQELKGQLQFQKEARQQARELIEALVEADGVVSAEWLESLPQILRQLTRLTITADSREFSLWNRKSEKRIAKLITQTHLLAQTGLWNPEESESLRSVIKLAAPYFGLSKENYTQATKSVSNKSSKKSLKESFQSDWAEWACLRSQAASGTDQALVRHHAHDVMLNVIASEIPLLKGDWRLQLSINKETVELAEGWGCSCWSADEDAVYLELEQRPLENVTIVRQVLMLPGESLLLLADSVRTEDAYDIQLTSTLPLHENWEFEEDTQTRELALTQSKKRIRVFPVTAPPSKVQRSDQNWKIDSDKVTITSQTNLKRLYSATVFEWSPQRKNAGAEWAPLTVVERYEPVDSSVAVGFRLAIGKHQWLYYHSLTQPEIPRSVMGAHTGNETLFARVDSSGALATLLEVEI